MKTELTLLCHAPTHAMRAGMFPCAEDPIEWPEYLPAGMTLDALSFERVLVSPARCARETAAALSLTATVDSALRELDYGDWQGRSLKEIVRDDPEGLQHWLADPATAPHRGESIEALARRVVDRLKNPVHFPGCTLLVTHASVIKVLLLEAVGAPLTAFSSVDVAPLSRVALTAFKDRWRLRIGESLIG
ncbi:histidine phosphatase family protein [Crenobacter cavernae]|uniref:Histidine phosphatase family protein n=1 Tax=Crenobacter cavernae TaxID=2290923 RepID=A0A345Y9D2_9NEIS|nr:histidine phosphatase family protein [Crenobacter cavernae]AXK40534.1 histidine phosphatase family protein [Crenobacter cavernae]